YDSRYCHAPCPDVLRDLCRCLPFEDQTERSSHCKEIPTRILPLSGCGFAPHAPGRRRRSHGKKRLGGRNVAFDCVCSHLVFVSEKIGNSCCDLRVMLGRRWPRSEERRVGKGLRVGWV